MFEFQCRSCPTGDHTIWYIHFGTFYWVETQDDNMSEVYCSEQRRTNWDLTSPTCEVLPSPQTNPWLGYGLFGNKGKISQQCWRLTRETPGKSPISWGVILQEDVRMLSIVWMSSRTTVYLHTLFFVLFISNRLTNNLPASRLKGSIGMLCTNRIQISLYQGSKLSRHVVHQQTDKQIVMECIPWKQWWNKMTTGTKVSHAFQIATQSR